MTPMRYCDSPYLYQRRKSREVVIGDPAKGGIIIGGDHPVVKQSMLTCDTMDTATCVTQTLELVEAGCQLVRITAPTVKDAANLRNIVAELRGRGCHVPIVADIHFKPEAAMEAAQWVEVCYCPTPLQEERPYWEEYFELVKVQEAHDRRRCRDENGSEPWACGDCDCTARLEEKLKNTGKPFLELLHDSLTSSPP